MEEKKASHPQFYPESVSEATEVLVALEHVLGLLSLWPFGARIHFSSRAAVHSEIFICLPGSLPPRLKACW